MREPICLGVNIDHIATLRQARGTTYPCPVEAALVAERAGADGITLHLREDRRHIQDDDVYTMAKLLKTRMNLELAVTEEMIAIAQAVKPAHACFVPEKREEVTTEGGLDVISHFDSVKNAVEALKRQGTRVSLFIDPSIEQITAAKETGADDIEIHTGKYAEALGDELQQELDVITKAALHGHEIGLRVNAGHGLHYHNVQPIAAIAHIYELNIGHAIVARAAFDGLEKAVRDMRALMVEARQ